MEEKREMRIGQKEINDNDVYIIAEIGKNYNGDINLAKRLIEIAAECGVDAVKFQSIRADSLIIRDMPKVAHIKETVAESNYEMHKKFELSLEEHIYLSQVAKQNGLEFFSTPEDLEMVDLLEKVGVNVYKVASLDLTFIPLLEKIASKRKPVIVSTGMATIDEIAEVVSFFKRRIGDSELALLHCVSNYPPKDENLNLNFIRTLKRTFALPIGYSDHSIGIEASIAAAALGACIIEKHITLEKTLPGPDHRISADPQELALLVKGVRRVKKMLGSETKVISSDEMEMRKNVRRKVVAEKDLKEGMFITMDSIGFKISPVGLDARQYSIILGKKVKRDIKKDEPITTEDIG